MLINYLVLFLDRVISRLIKINFLGLGTTLHTSIFKYVHANIDNSCKITHHWLKCQQNVFLWSHEETWVKEEEGVGQEVVQDPEVAAACLQLLAMVDDCVRNRSRPSLALVL